jgi:hypothetical protein
LERIHLVQVKLQQEAMVCRDLAAQRLHDLLVLGADA